MAFSLPPSIGFNFNDSLSASGKIEAAKGFVAEGASAPTLWEKAGDLDATVKQAFSPESLAAGGKILSNLGIDTSQFQFLGGAGGPSTPAWTFITAPEDISWSVANKVDRVDIFGTNNPPVVAGSRGMRDLELGNALVEGFVRNVQVEGKVAALEALMNYSLNTSDGFVSVPVYQVWANNKSYGGAQAYYVIESVRVKETMRDLQGNTTRAYVDISLKQVPAYQVNSGRDQASKGTAGGFDSLKGVVNQAEQNIAGSAARGGATPGAAGTKPAAGPGAGGAARPASSAGSGSSSKPAAPKVVPLDPSKAPPLKLLF